MKLSFIVMFLVIGFSIFSLSAQQSGGLGGVPSVQGLTLDEQRVLSLINGSRIYQNAVELENIALSQLAFRSGGSPGANATALWVMDKFKSLGLDTYNESFQFTNWNLLSQPSLVIDVDGNPATTGDQVNMITFSSDHLSWSTPLGGVFADLVVLPLPDAADISEIGLRPINSTLWNSINTAGKILFIGKEVTWDYVWLQTYVSKISSQIPKAIVLSWWYDWSSFGPPTFPSGGGRPLSGAYYWNLHIPVGWVDYQEGMTIRNLEKSLNVSAKFVLDSQIGQGTHYNVIGKMLGETEPSKYVIVSGHMDSVVTAGFCDNAGGTAAVVELARAFSEAVTNGWYHPAYTILFVAFTDEEFGLVGSINYAMKHKSEIANIVAVLNVDCIGDDNFQVSRTDPDPATGLDLDQVVLTAAQDLGVPATVTRTGGSDQETFRNPSYANNMYSNNWGLSAGIGSLPPVEPSVILVSSPISWIHTRYDNSTSTAALNWISASNLENHTKIGALTLMRISGVSGEPDIAVVNVTISKTVVGKGCIAAVNVTVENQGGVATAINVTLYVNLTIVEVKNLFIAVGTRSNLTFNWFVSGYAKGNYHVSAYVAPISNETDTSDNTMVDGWIRVSMMGDLTGPSVGVPDGKVDIRDLALIAVAYGSYPGHSRWNANADITGQAIGIPDNKVDMRDLSLAATNYGKIDP